MARCKQTSRKHVKLTRTVRVITPSIDIISSLPDSIVCHILSFLPTKDSVATSVLASKWRFLWAQVTSIKFDARRENIDSEVFPDAMDSVLLINNEQCINTLKLHLSPLYEWCDANEFETWISMVVARNVQVLDLSLAFNHEFSLPDCLFISKTLVEFKLEDLHDLSVGDVCLPNLKKLHLLYVSFDDDEALPRLISGCSVLEELRIQSSDDGIIMNISSPTLKHLIMDDLEDEDLEQYKELYKRMLKLDTPALQYLNLQDPLYNCISSQKQSSIVEADIYLSHGLLKEDIPYLLSLFEFVESVSAVKFLKLSCPLEMKLISTKFATSTTKFQNLIKLDFKADWSLLTRFLEIADKLEILIINEVDANLRCWSEPEKVPLCLLSCLRSVTIHQSRFGEHDFNMISYIMRNAKYLKRMEIHTCTMSINVRRRISNFCRGSEECEVDFIYE